MIRSRGVAKSSACRTGVSSRKPNCFRSICCQFIVPWRKTVSPGIVNASSTRAGRIALSPRQVDLGRRQRGQEGVHVGLDAVVDPLQMGRLAPVIVPACQRDSAARLPAGDTERPRADRGAGEDLAEGGDALRQGRSRQR